MHEHRNIEKEKDTEEYEGFFMADGKLFPWIKYGVYQKTTHRDTKMEENVYPYIMTSINTKCRILKDRKLPASKDF